MTTLHYAFDDTTRKLIFHVPIIATPGLLNMDLAIGSLLYHMDNLGMGLHQFGLIQKARVDQHQVIAGAVGAPTLANAAFLMVPYGFSLTKMVAIAQIIHIRLLVVLYTLIGRDHPSYQGMETVVLALIER